MKNGCMTLLVITALLLSSCNFQKTAVTDKTSDALDITQQNNEFRFEVAQNFSISEEMKKIVYTALYKLSTHENIDADDMFSDMVKAKWENLSLKKELWVTLYNYMYIDKEICTIRFGQERSGSNGRFGIIELKKMTTGLSIACL